MSTDDEGTAKATRRGVREVVERCLCMEMAAERAAYEGADHLSREELESCRLNLLEVAKFLGVDGQFTEPERKALDTPIGQLASVEEEIATIYGDIPYLLWALGRIPTLYSVDDLGPRLPEILGEGFINVGDRHAIKKAMAEARLRPEKEVEAMLFDIAKANALMAAASEGDEPSTTVPPATAFYVLPWLQDTAWPWGAPCELMTEHDGVRLTFGIDGIRPAESES